MCLGQGADQFLGAQGDIWDTQSDMLMALIGSIVALIVIRCVRESLLLDEAVSVSLSERYSEENLFIIPK